MTSQPSRRLGDTFHVTLDSPNAGFSLVKSPGATVRKR